MVSLTVRLAQFGLVAGPLRVIPPTRPEPVCPLVAVAGPDLGLGNGARWRRHGGELGTEKQLDARLENCQFARRGHGCRGAERLGSVIPRMGRGPPWASGAGRWRGEGEDRARQGRRPAAFGAFFPLYL